MKLSNKIFLAMMLIGSQRVYADIKGPIAVSIDKQEDGSNHVMGRFMLDAPIALAWKTLADYENLGSFVPTVRESHRIKEENGKIYVQQTMVGEVGFFRKKISLLLEITETAPLKLEFRDISGQSFRTYHGSWEIDQWDNGLAITYNLYATPNFFAPDFVAKGVFKQSVRDLLENVQDEIIRKSQLASQKE